MWNINGPDKPLHFMNHLRVPLIRNVLLNHPIESQSLCNTPSPLKNYHILDVGCGVGILSEVNYFSNRTVSGFVQYNVQLSSIFYTAVVNTSPKISISFYIFHSSHWLDWGLMLLELILSKRTSQLPMNTAHVIRHSLPLAAVSTTSAAQWRMSPMVLNSLILW